MKYSFQHNQISNGNHGVLAESHTLFHKVDKTIQTDERSNGWSSMLTVNKVRKKNNALRQRIGTLEKKVKQLFHLVKSLRKEVRIIKAGGANKFSNSAEG